MPSFPETSVDSFSNAVTSVPVVPGPSSGSAPSSGPGSSGSAKGLVPRYTDHDLVTAVNQAINTLKRKIQDVYECAICLSITRDGQIVQCQRGHIFCSICLDKSNRTTCPTCEAPIDRNNKIRALAAEKLIDSVDLEFPCKHADCHIRLPKTNLSSHEDKCEKRSVPCPDGGCNQQVPFHTLLRHMANSKATATNTAGVIFQEFSVRQNLYTNNGGITWSAVVVKYQRQTFFVTFARVDGIYYTYVQIYGDIDEAKKYRATISVGYETQTGIVHHGKVFSIDAKASEILQERSGVLSFHKTGMAEAFFYDEMVSGRESKVIRIKFNISKAPGGNEAAPKVKSLVISSDTKESSVIKDLARGVRLEIEVDKVTTVFDGSKITSLAVLSGMVKSRVKEREWAWHHSKRAPDCLTFTYMDGDDCITLNSDEGLRMALEDLKEDGKNHLHLTYKSMGNL